MLQPHPGAEGGLKMGIRRWQDGQLLIIQLAILLRVANAWSISDNDGDHKPLWPLDERDYATFGLAALGLIVAAGGE
jgi:hypothetical protein